MFCATFSLQVLETQTKSVPVELLLSNMLVISLIHHIDPHILLPQPPLDLLMVLIANSQLAAAPRLSNVDHCSRHKKIPRPLGAPFLTLWHTPPSTSPSLPLFAVALWECEG